MGANNSSLSNDHTLKYEMIIANYNFIRKVKDIHYGDVTILEDKQTNELVALKETISRSTVEFNKQIANLKVCNNMIHPNIIKLYGYTHKLEDNLCTSFYKFLIVVEYLDQDLESEISAHISNTQYYSEDQLWYIAETLVAALANLQKVNIIHGDLKPANILISKKDMVYKIAEPSMLNSTSMPSYHQKLSGFNDIKCYLSPSLIKALQKKELRPKHNAYKSDVFSLGMILLHAAMLQDCQKFYKWDNFTIDQVAVEAAINSLRAKKYSESLVNLLKDMLNFQEDIRPDFIELNQKIQNSSSNAISNGQNLQIKQQNENHMKPNANDTINHNKASANKTKNNKSSNSTIANSNSTTIHSNHGIIMGNEDSNSENLSFSNDNDSIEAHNFPSNFTKTLIISNEKNKPKSQGSKSPLLKQKTSSEHTETLKDVVSSNGNGGFSQLSQDVIKSVNTPIKTSDKQQSDGYQPSDEIMKIMNEYGKAKDNNDYQYLGYPQSYSLTPLNHDLYSNNTSFIGSPGLLNTQSPGLLNTPSTGLFNTQSPGLLNTQPAYQSGEEMARIISEFKNTNFILNSSFDDPIKQYQLSTLQQQPITPITQDYLLKIPNPIPPYLPTSGYIPGSSSITPIIHNTHHNYEAFKSSTPSIDLHHHHHVKTPSFQLTQLPNYPISTDNVELTNPKAYTWKGLDKDMIQATNTPTYIPQIISIGNDFSTTIATTTTTATTNNTSPSPRLLLPEVNFVGSGNSLTQTPYIETKPKVQPIEIYANQHLSLSSSSLVNLNNSKDIEIKLSTHTTPPISGLNGLYEKVTEHYMDGSIYEGEKLNGYRHGKGKFYYSDGGMYDGEWDCGTMHGYGTLYYPGGSIAYHGEWKEDKFYGKGTVYNESPQSTPGNMIDYRNFDNLDEYWVKYEGEFLNDNKDGYGILWLTNGDKYQGLFKDDLAHGKGVYQFADGRSVIGEWWNNMLQSNL